MYGVMKNLRNFGRLVFTRLQSGALATLNKATPHHCFDKAGKVTNVSAESMGSSMLANYLQKSSQSIVTPLEICILIFLVSRSLIPWSPIVL